AYSPSRSSTAPSASTKWGRNHVGFDPRSAPQRFAEQAEEVATQDFLHGLIVVAALDQSADEAQQTRRRFEPHGEGQVGLSGVPLELLRIREIVRAEGHAVDPADCHERVNLSEDVFEPGPRGKIPR